MERRGRRQSWEEGEFEMEHSPKMVLASQRWNGASKSAKLRARGWAFIPLRQSLGVGCLGNGARLGRSDSLAEAVTEGV